MINNLMYLLLGLENFFQEKWWDGKGKSRREQISRKESNGVTGETNRTGEKDRKWGKVEIETAVGGWELKRKGLMETMCRHIKFMSTSH